jgi:hypothetical protein
MRLPMMRLENITLTITTIPLTISPLWEPMSVITSTSGRLHSEFVHLLFWQDHRETDRFFTGSGVQLPHHDWSMLRSKPSLNIPTVPEDHDCSVNQVSTSTSSSCSCIRYTSMNRLDSYLSHMVTGSTKQVWLSSGNNLSDSFDVCSDSGTSHSQLNFII